MLTASRQLYSAVEPLYGEKPWTGFEDKTTRREIHIYERLVLTKHYQDDEDKYRTFECFYDMEENE